MGVLPLFAAVAVAVVAFAPAVEAQYYPPPPYERPYYGDPYRQPPGFRCDARVGTPYGLRQVICPMRQPRPLGEICHCPEAGPYGQPARGRIIP